ncbi:conserved membrane protein of unknown function [Candidatus Filomicrobium marinum]|uniref:LytTR family transcriptional regulator n=1 Tax=Candidatus Filomicrobium marinum TaxID=1608628 RepID=A0A0D6JAV3_9HYPH|nr:DUF4159 domain-containing protein [Candidatus Filomicrobium marinum]CFX00575.1 conserved membrane protein of unknown function [Candidatus Filomicrobium marinum]CPR15265.1 conserved membrane protein of unknown function [Candidatus Filomicrobium marinum]
MTLGALAFLNPWLLLALGTLPIIYWLLRTVPPRPQQLTFPPTRILVGLENREKTPAKSPWWLLLIRLLAAALVILALAEPILNPERNAPLAGEGPVAIVVDNGWASAPDWTARQAMVDRMISTAESQSRPVVIVPTAFPAQTFEAKIEAPAQARATARAMMPQPFAPTRNAAAEALSKTLTAADAKGVSVIWLSDGVDHKGETTTFAEMMNGLATSGTFTVVDDPTGSAPRALVGNVGTGGKLEARVLRTGTNGPANGILHAYSTRGAQLGSAQFTFNSGASETKATFELPLELRNQITRIAIADSRSAGAVSLLDARSQWQRVGLISSETSEQAQPLLAPFYYIEKALAPTAEIVKPRDANLAAGIDQALAQNVSILIFADIGTLTPEAEDQVRTWIEKGGVLVRFAGPRLEKGGDDLLPVPLRIGGRTLGGALSWSTPQKLAPFDENSLFAGLTIPNDVVVNRQVLADPARLTPETQVWARLADGTPLVTADRRGDGMIVLFHVTGNSDWSNLPISGLFVELLKRVSTLGRLGGSSETTDAQTSANGEEVASDTSTLAPLQTLDGFGVLTPPPPASRGVEVAKFADTTASLEHPPGYYGSRGSPRAINIIRSNDTLAPITSLPTGAAHRSYENAEAEPMKPWLLAAAFALILADMIAVLLLQSGGRLFGRSGPAVARSVVAMAVIATSLAATFHAAPAFAQAGVQAPRQNSATDDAKAMAATSKVTLGYVVTGDAQTDDTSRIGLAGLCRVLALRTAVTPGDPMPVDVVKDELAFYPVLYWPVLDSTPTLPEETLAKIDAYMKQGGMIVFDTRDQGRGMPAGLGFPGSESSALQRILGKLDIPRLEPVPQNHVLTKSFYLLRSFPGRWDSGQLWVEAGGVASAESNREARRADGVSTILITSNDFAAAWALDANGRPLYPTVPGGEGQREMAFRTGINIVMHALTGNYKADQVHVPALLERLGQ